MKKSNVNKANPFVAADNAVAAAVKDVVAALKKDGVYDFGDKTRLAHLMAEWVQEEFEGSVVIGISKKAIRLQVVEVEVDGEKPTKSKSKSAPEAKGKSKGKPAVEDEDEDSEQPSGFIYLVFSDSDDAENFLKAATKRLQENGFEDEDEIEALIGRNGEEGEFLNHVYVDDQIWEETLEAMFTSKKFQNSLDDDVEVYDNDADYLAVVSDADDAEDDEDEDEDDAEDDEDEDEDDEVEVSPAQVMFDKLAECKAHRGRAKAVRELIEEAKNEYDFESFYKWKPQVYKDFFEQLEVLADSTQCLNIVSELYYAVQGDTNLSKATLKAFTKAFAEWQMDDE